MIAIDGPAGAGKSTVAKLLAKKLGLRYLDTGAMYRALALKASEVGLSARDGDAAAALLASTEIRFGEGEPQPVFLDGMDVTSQIRTHRIGEAASSLSTSSVVRRALVALQREMVAGGGVILEGRDATTVIAPHADVKVFLTASLEERARRRRLEFVEKGEEHSFEEVREQIENRDHRDITRDDSPLRVAEDAHLIETAGRTPHDIAEAIVSLLHPPSSPSRYDEP